MVANWSMKVRTGRVICENMARKATKPPASSEPRTTSMPPKMRMTPAAEMPRNSLMGDASCWRRTIESSSREKSALMAWNFSLMYSVAL